MTLTELMNSPAGTMTISVRENDGTTRDDLRFIATHREKVQRAVRPVDFYGETADIALAQAEVYDKKRKELRASWKSNYKTRRQAV